MGLLTCKPLYLSFVKKNKNNMGRYKLIESPEKMWSLFEEYKVEVKSDPYIIIDYVGKDAIPVNRMKEKPLTMEGFECYVANIPNLPWGLDEYFGNYEGKYKDFSAVCSRIKREIKLDQVGGGMAGLFNPSITQRLNGLVDKVETTVKKEQPLFGDEPGEA